MHQYLYLLEGAGVNIVVVKVISELMVVLRSISTAILPSPYVVWKCNVPLVSMEDYDPILIIHSPVLQISALMTATGDAFIYDMPLPKSLGNMSSERRKSAISVRWLKRYPNTLIALCRHRLAEKAEIKHLIVNKK